MTITANLHRVKSVTADRGATCSWLSIEDREGNAFTIFMEYHEAEAMADAWAEAQIEPDPLDAETIARRGETYRRDMIATGRGHLLGEGQ